MGPFVPDIISDQLNLVVALIIGVAFGFVLEQAGFSSCRRLAGLFYGYDFTVLRVFFSAAVTAMLGTLLLGYFGYLDLSAIYINPTWLWPAVVGGVVMGLGFILGGYCPGTSLAALAIGKIDALFFVIGGVAGVFVFAEAYPAIHAFNESSSLGSIKVFESIGMSQGAFVLMLVIMAVGAFAATSWIEAKVSKDAPSKSHPVRIHRIAAIVVVILAAIVAFLPDRKASLMAEVTSAGYVAAHPVDTITSDELAFRIIDRDPNLRIFDLRKPAEFAKNALPGAMNIQIDDLFKRDLAPDLGLTKVQKVFVADDDATAKQACQILGALGYRNVSALEKGYGAFESRVLTVGFTVPGEDPVVAAYRKRARVDLLRLMKEAKEKGTTSTKKEKKIVGGC